MIKAGKGICRDRLSVTGKITKIKGKNCVFSLRKRIKSSGSSARIFNSALIFPLSDSCVICDGEMFLLPFAAD